MTVKIHVQRTPRGSSLALLVVTFALWTVARSSAQVATTGNQGAIEPKLGRSAQSPPSELSVSVQKQVALREKIVRYSPGISSQSNTGLWQKRVGSTVSHVKQRKSKGGPQFLGRAANRLAYTIDDCWWESAIDHNENGYARGATLATDVDVDDEQTHNVFLKIYRKLAGSSTYEVYSTTTSYPITGFDVDPILVQIGSPNQELGHNTYDFKVEVYEAGGTVVLGSRDEADPDLDNQNFETVAQDASFSIEGCWWTDAVDQESDGYTRYRKLQTDVDVDDGQTHNVFLKIYRKLTSSSTYEVYSTTTNYPITGYNVDPIAAQIGSPIQELDHNTYDFKVEVYEAGGTVLLVSRDEIADPSLYGQKFETTAQDSPVPIQLASFTVKLSLGGQALLEWMTASETNNYGFEVDRRGATDSAYGTLPNSFIPGHGTTIIPHCYSYVDSTVSDGVWLYRLKQVDLDGTTHYSEGVQVSVLTDVEKNDVPAQFSLGQNYPNPFNPSTTISYALPMEADVSLVVYDMLGREVARLVEGRMSAGHYDTKFDASPLASGIYFYRLSASTSSGQAGDASTRSPQGFVQTRRLVVVK